MIPPREQRNKALIARRDSDPKRWTFEALGKKYGIKPSTAFEIYHREKTRAGEHTRVSPFIARKYPLMTKKAKKDKAKRLSTSMV